jgi:hypothetical protein
MTSYVVVLTGGMRWPLRRIREELKEEIRPYTDSPEHWWRQFMRQVICPERTQGE